MSDARHCRQPDTDDMPTALFFRHCTVLEQGRFFNGRVDGSTGFLRDEMSTARAEMVLARLLPEWLLTVGTSS